MIGARGVLAACAGGGDATPAATTPVSTAVGGIDTAAPQSPGRTPVVLDLSPTISGIGATGLEQSVSDVFLACSPVADYLLNLGGSLSCAGFDTDE